MERNNRRMNSCAIVITAAAIATATLADGEVRLADQGEAKCVIVVPAGTMPTNALPARAYGLDQAGRRRLLVDSVRDLAFYLGKMSGATIEITEGLPAGDKRIPIYIGAEGQKAFGKVGASKAGLYGFRVVVEDRVLRRPRIGLYGESEFGTSYAIYELLHRLGCRWYMPGEIGECIPKLPELAVAKMNETMAPATEYRGMWHGGADWLRRNRMNGTYLENKQGLLESYISKEQLEANPEWRMVTGGKPSRMFRFTRQDVAEAIADTIIKQLDVQYKSSVSLVPGDYVLATDDPEDMKYDPVPRVWEPAAGRWSVTDRLILLVNRIAERVTKKYPDVLFGVLAYVNYSMPPVKQDVHPNVVPVLAPIDFNRHHPMTWPDHPNQTWLLDMVEGWSKKSSRIAAYWYGMNLAELSAPNPFITKWGTDIPILLKNKLAYWMPETMGGWESMLPGYYLAVRMTFHADEKPDAILEDLWTRFYGSAAEPMARYWHIMDRAWIDAGEYAGCFFGYLRIFTPEVLDKSRAAINEALTLAGVPTSLEYRRVKLIEESLMLFEQFMKMRRDWAAGRLDGLGSNFDAWRSGISAMTARYGLGDVIQGRFGSLIYPDAFLAGAYRDATRIAQEHLPLSAPLVRWQYRHDAEKKAEPLGWTKPEFDDTEWKTTHVVMDTWSSLGHHNTMGRMAYRATAHLEPVPAGKKAFVWIGSTDGSAKLFVNGQHVKYVTPDKGEAKDTFNGYCQPAQFDVTSVVKPGANQITILCERNWLNELGTGGLMGPVMAVREK